jgi:zinc transport system permease protein
VVVVVGMRVVGLLLVSAIMIVPVAAAQQVTRSFRATGALAIVIGLVSSVSGLVGSFYVEVPPGPTIVLFALLAFAVLATIAVPVRRRRRESS